MVEYDRRAGPTIPKLLRNLYEQMVEKDRRMEKLFPKVPRIAFKRGQNLKELLCSAKLPPERKIETR